MQTVCQVLLKSYLVSADCSLTGTSGSHDKSKEIDQKNYKRWAAVLCLQKNMHETVFIGDKSVYLAREKFENMTLRVVCLASESKVESRRDWRAEITVRRRNFFFLTPYHIAGSRLLLTTNSKCIPFSLVFRRCTACARSVSENRAPPMDLRV